MLFVIVVLSFNQKYIQNSKILDHLGIDFLIRQHYILVLVDHPNLSKNTLLWVLESTNVLQTSNNEIGIYVLIHTEL